MASETRMRPVSQPFLRNGGSSIFLSCLFRLGFGRPQQLRNFLIIGENLRDTVVSKDNYYTL